MPHDMYNFLKEIEKENPKDYFLFSKFYFYPEESLGTKDNQQYYEENDVKYLIMNSNFLKFLEFCIEEDRFKKKLNLDLLNKIRSFLFDTKDFVTYYAPELEDESLRQWCRNKNPVGDYDQKYSILELWGIACHYDSVGWMYELNLGKTRNEIDLDLVDKLITANSKQITVFEEIENSLKEKRDIIKTILKDDYENDFYPFLATNNGHNQKVLRTIICDNDFLEVCDNILKNQKLPDLIVDNIIDILEVSVAFKTLDYSLCTDFNSQYEKISKEI